MRLSFEISVERLVLDRASVSVLSSVFGDSVFGDAVFGDAVFGDSLFGDQTPERGLNALAEDYPR